MLLKKLKILAAHRNFDDITVVEF